VFQYYFWPVLLMLNHTFPSSSPWCPSSQRYDVHRFPPRCLDCSKIILNPMRLSSISASVRPRQPVAKFSPGLPHNQSCGCWRSNQTVDVQLNASWVVSGLTFHADRFRWLKQFSIAASEDGVSFLDWGTYTQSNFTSSSTVLFRYPIKASVFRLSVFEYVNHMVNVSTGFPLKINALVSDTQPFGCECATLPTGECCPRANMEVKNGTCVLCMDPRDIHTVMVDGCGRCKPGTVPFGLRCVVPPRSSAVRRSLEVSHLVSDGRDAWSARVEVAANVPVVVLLSPDAFPQCALCFARIITNESYIPVLWDVDLNRSKDEGFVTPTKSWGINQQYLQFDRGRLVLVMSERLIRSWARCTGFQCVGFLGALFIDQFSVVDVIQRRLVFDLAIPLTPPLVCLFSRRLIPTSVELHHLLDTNQYLLLFTSPELQNTSALVQWDDRLDRTAVASDGIMTTPPPSSWSSMRIFARDQQYYVAHPVPVVRRNAPRLALQVAKESTLVTIAYGLTLASSPEPGDSEQLVTISAVSKQPVRLTRLASVAAGGQPAMYTTAKGFISDPKRALDLAVACNGMLDTAAMVRWLEAALGLIGSNTESFVEGACRRVHKGEVSKLYWLVPALPTSTRRNQAVKMSVEVVFS